MNASELRVGNWVLGPLGEFMQVNILGHLKHHNYIHSIGDGIFGQNGFEPILLTPEIMMKCGFEKIKDGNMAFPELWRKEYQHRLVKNKVDISIRGNDEVYWIEGNTIVELHSLHQLQNLFYCLTGEELNYKP